MLNLDCVLEQALGLEQSSIWMPSCFNWQATSLINHTDKWVFPLSGPPNEHSNFIHLLFCRLDRKSWYSIHLRPRPITSDANHLPTTQHYTQSFFLHISVSWWKRQFNNPYPSRSQPQDIFTARWQASSHAALETLNAGLWMNAPWLLYSTTGSSLWDTNYVTLWDLKAASSRRQLTQRRRRRKLKKRLWSQPKV